MNDAKMATDVVTQAVIQGGAFVVLSVLILVVGPKVLKSILSQFTRENKRMVKELGRVRAALSRNNNLTYAVVLYLAQHSGDAKLRAMAERAVSDDQRHEEEGDEEDEEDEEDMDRKLA